MKHWRPARRLVALATLALTGAAAACGGSDEGPPACPKFSQVTLWKNCVPCHSSANTTPAERMDATSGVNFDVYESAKMNGELANVWVMTGLMPPSPRPAPTEEEKASLQAWIDCGMPK